MALLNKETQDKAIKMLLHFWTSTPSAGTKTRTTWQQAAVERKAEFVWWGGRWNSSQTPKERKHRRWMRNSYKNVAIKTTPTGLFHHRKEKKRILLSAANHDESTHTFSGQNQMEQHKYAFFALPLFFFRVNLLDMCLFMAHEAIHDQIKNTKSKTQSLRPALRLRCSLFKERESMNYWVIVAGLTAAAEASTLCWKDKRRDF